MHNADLEMMFASAGRPPDGIQPERILRWLEDPLRAQRLVEFAVQEGLAGLFYRKLEAAGLLWRLDDAAHQQLKAAYHRIAAENIRRLHVLPSILEALEKGGLQPVVLQGTALLFQVYPDPGLRPMKDLDLWLLPADLAAAARVFSKLGFEANPWYPRLFSREDILLDVHTHILWADRIRARRLLLNGSQKEIYHRRRIMEFEGRPVAVLDPLDQVIYLGLHLLKHRAERGIWLMDIRALAGRWGAGRWTAFGRRCRQMGLDRFAAQLVFLLHDIPGFVLPAGAPAWLRAPRLSALERKVLSTRRNRGRLPAWGPLALFWSAARGPAKLPLLRETLFPAPAVLQQVFADTPGLTRSQLYWKRTRQLAAALRSSLTHSSNSVRDA